MITGHAEPFSSADSVYLRLRVSGNNNMQQLSILLRNLSCETWERIGFSRNRNGLKIFETTITQNIIFNIHLHKPSNFIIYEATDEKTNGNDIELFIETKKGFLFLAIQSKIIYKKENYLKMEHGNQLDDLMNYAFSRGGKPFYLLYNYSKDFRFKDTVCGIPCNEKDFGCTLIGAEYLLENYAFKKTNKHGEKKWNIPSFSDLHPQYAIPWFILTSCLRNVNNGVGLLQKVFPYIRADDSTQIRLYSWGDISQSVDWHPLTLVNGYIGEPELNPYVAYSNSDNLNVNDRFAPKFRMIFRSE